MEFLISRHYQIVTESSASNGDVEESGTISDRERMSFREVVEQFSEMQQTSCYPIDGPDHCSHVWASTEPEIDYATGEERTESVHVLNADGTHVSPRNMYRILRAANLAQCNAIT